MQAKFGIIIFEKCENDLGMFAIVGHIKRFPIDNRLLSFCSPLLPDKQHHGFYSDVYI